jgi:hypothetical protein
LCLPPCSPCLLLLIHLLLFFVLSNSLPVPPNAGGADLPMLSLYQSTACHCFAILLELPVWSAHWRGGKGCGLYFQNEAGSGAQSQNTETNKAETTDIKQHVRKFPSEHQTTQNRHTPHNDTI